jgi:putative transposase
MTHLDALTTHMDSIPKNKGLTLGYKDSRVEGMTKTIVKTYKYRMYPSVTQEKIMDQWVILCRYIYNICVEQRRMLFDLYSHQPMMQELNEKGYQKSDRHVSPLEDPRRYTNWVIQCREVTQIRKVFPEFSEVPAGVMSCVVNRVDQAFKKYYSNLKDYRNGKLKKFPLPPGFSSRFDDFSLLHKRWNGFKCILGEGNIARIYGFPNMPQGLRVRLHTPIDGRVVQQQIKKENNQWFLCITIEKEIVLPLTIRPSVGVDLGITRTVQLSNGEYQNLPYAGMKELLDRKKVLQRRLKKKIGGDRKRGVKQSNNYKKAYERISKIDQKIANIRQYHLKRIATEIARDHGVVVVEKLKVKNMTKSAKGTSELPGKNVKAKSGLNRQILLTSPYFFRTFLEQKCNELSSNYIEVNPAYTSQDCSKCGHRHSDNRISQAQFKCQSCGFESNADHNAAINILKISEIKTC